MTSAFLPTNLDKGTRERQGRKLRLVRVDDELLPYLLRRPWRYQRLSGKVFRQRAGRGMLGPEPLTAAVLAPRLVKTNAHTEPLFPTLDVDPRPVYFKNGDTLDFRRDNLTYNATEAGEHVAPGLTFEHLPEYAKALTDVDEREDYYRAESRTGNSCWSISCTLAILHTVRNYPGLTHDALYKAIQVDLPEVRFPSKETFRNILCGRVLRVPGFDYEALKATRHPAGRPATKGIFT